MSSVTKGLATFAADTSPDDIPPDVRHQTVRIIYDTLTCCVHGSEGMAPKIIEEVMAGFGGNAEASVLASGARIAAPSAAFANAMAANSRDLDDNLLYFSHIANTVVASALAMAERLDLDGRALVTAVAVGYEVAGRISLALPGIYELTDDDRIVECNPHNHSFNIFGGVVAAGRLLGLDAERMGYALGLAGYSAPVPSMAKSSKLPRWTLSKYGAYGWQAWSGCVSASLAHAGIDADDTVLDGPFGFWRMVGVSSFDEETAVGGLGKKWWLLEDSFKLEPAGTWMRPPLRALRMVLADSRLEPAEITRIEVAIRPLGKKGSVFWKDDPERYIDAQVSYQYLLAMEALGIPPQDWQNADVVTSPAVKDMIGKIEVIADEDAERHLIEQLRERPHRARGTLSRVTVWCGDSNWSAVSEYGDGDPYTEDTRITDEKLDQKFQRFAAPVLGPNADEAPRAAWGLETTTSARELAAAFCVSGA